MNLFSWIGKTFGLTSKQDAAFWQYVGGAYENPAGMKVTTDTVLGLSAAWACQGLIARTIAALPVSVYERLPDGSRKAAPEHAVNKLLKSPNSDMTSFEFIEQMVYDLLQVGNSFTEKQGTRDSYPISLNPLNNNFLKISRDTNGALVYEYTQDGKTRRIPENKLFTVRGNYMGGDLGVSAIQYGAASMGLAIAGDLASARLFGQGIQAQGFLKIAQTIKDEAQRKQFIDIWVAPLMGARNAGKVGVLEAGMEWVAVEAKAVDAELLSSRKFSVEEVCRWYGVPPVLIGHAGEGQTMWGSGIEQINLAFLVHTIRPWLRRIQSAAAARLFTPVDREKYYLEFNVDGLLEADSAGRAAMYGAALQNGWMTRNEIRGKENLPKSTQKGADDLTAQTSLAPLDKLGEIANKSATSKSNPSEAGNEK